MTLTLGCVTGEVASVRLFIFVCLSFFHFLMNLFVPFVFNLLVFFAGWTERCTLESENPTCDGQHQRPPAKRYPLATQQPPITVYAHSRILTLTHRAQMRHTG